MTNNNSSSSSSSSPSSSFPSSSSSSSSSLSSPPPPPPRPFHCNLLAGALAGTSVDVILFPLDTIKTRMQSAQGFRAAGGFRGLFNGVMSAAIGSAPGASLFFVSYEGLKSYGSNNFSSVPPALLQCFSAGLAEISACLIRVPTENIKQKLQTGMYSSTSIAVSSVMKDGVRKGFYRGFGTTLMREIPFAFIQFPIYERLKVEMRNILHKKDKELQPYQSALCGSVSGGIAAALTTPLDVAKTRIMLKQNQKNKPSTTPIPATVTPITSAVAAAESGSNNISISSPKESLGTFSTLRSIYKEGGINRLFSGIVPRVFWISVGGFVFFGAYEEAHKMLKKLGVE